MKFSIKSFFAGIIVSTIVGLTITVYASELYSLVRVEYPIYINDTKLESDLPVFNYEGRTYIPLRDVSVATGANVLWNNDTKSIKIIPIIKEKTVEVVKEVIKQVPLEVDNNGGIYNLPLGEHKNVSLFCDNKYIFGLIDRDNTGSGYQYTFDKAGILITKYDKYNEVSSSNYSLDVLINAIRHKPSNYNLILVKDDEILSIDTSDVIVSKIESDFEGFNENNVYKLSNGQIWQQISYGYEYHYEYNPDVVIYKDGSKYKMLVEGCDDTPEVEFLK